MSRGALALAAVLALAGCGRGPLVLDKSHAGRTYTMQRGEPLTIALRAQPTTGYKWELVERPDPVLRLEGAPEFVQDSAPAGMVGVPGTETWRFTAAAPGLVTLQLAYRRPWERGKGPADQFMIDVTVK